MHPAASVICWDDVIVIGAHYRNTYWTGTGSSSNSACEKDADAFGLVLMASAACKEAVLAGGQDGRSTTRDVGIQVHMSTGGREPWPACASSTLTSALAAGNWLLASWLWIGVWGRLTESRRAATRRARSGLKKQEVRS